MNRRSTSRLPALLFLACLPFVLAACGNKGPLVLPSAPASTAVPAAEAPSDAAEPPADAATEPAEPASSEPAPSEPAQTEPAPPSPSANAR